MKLHYVKGMEKLAVSMEDMIQGLTPEQVKAALKQNMDNVIAMQRMVYGLRRN